MYRIALVLLAALLLTLPVQAATRTATTRICLPVAYRGFSPRCCRYCGPAGKACGDSCINKAYTCHQPPGCACD